MPHASFHGLRVLSLESRRAKEVEKLIRTYNGEPFVVPAMREIPLESNTACFEFAEKLLAGKFDMAVFLTGVGVRAMLDTIATRFDRESVLSALRSIHVAARGVKPLGVLKELEIPVAAVAAEPTTWRELVTAIDARFGEELGSMRVAIQEYGATNPELIATLSERCASVTKVPVYQWGLPEDLQPLRECILALIHGSFDVVLFMTAVQVIHLFDVARQMRVEEEVREAFGSIAVLSIGPTTTEELQHYGITPDFEPSRPKMGFLVNEAAQYAAKVLESKRGGAASSSAIVAATSVDPTAKSAPAHGVRLVAPSTPTMAGFKNGLASFDIVDEAGVVAGAETERARLEAENSEFTDHLATRELVDRAKGVLQRDLALSEEEAYRTMQRESRQRRKSMREIAEAVILGDELRKQWKSDPPAGKEPEG